MNYEILIGKNVSINNTNILVNSIEKFTAPDFTIKYRINNGPVYSKIDIGTCVSIVEDEINKESKPKGLLNFFTNKFGLFYRTFVLDSSINTHTQNCIFYHNSLGLRTYGYHTVGIFAHVRFGLKVFEIEFCWNRKEEYNKGNLPESINNYNKIF